MKLLLTFLAAAMVVAFAEGHQFHETLDAKERSISSNIVDAIEAFKVQMPCGFPGLGLGPLAPARLTHKELHLGGEAFNVDGEVDDFIMYGLNDFDVKEFKVNAILSKVTFKFQWNHVHLESDYGMQMAKQTGMPQLAMKRKGGAKFAIRDLVVQGTARYSLGVISGNLRLKDFKLSISLGDVKSDIENLSSNRFLNRKMNEFIEEWIMLACNGDPAAMEDFTNNLVTPFVNEMIGDRSLSDLLGMIGGGGGSGDEPKPPKEPCVPDSFMDVI